MPTTPLTPTETRRLLEELELRPSRKLGQNFLIDGNIVAKSLALAEVAPDEDVIEVGPGLGTLTRALLTAGARVHAIERDSRLCSFLRDHLAPAFPDRLFLREDDAVEQPLANFRPAETGEFKIVANLPYAISTPWMDAVLKGDRLPVRMVLMLQRETAERFAADIGTRETGAITLFLQAAFTVERGHRVPRSCFHPQPDVDSFLLNLKRKTRPHRFSPETRTLVRRCFGQRRKQIASLLRKFAPEPATIAWLDRLNAAGLSGRARPEAIPLALWQELDRLMT